MNGIDLAIRLKAEYPDCRLSLFSGQAVTGGWLELARQKGHSFDILVKPIHPDEFIDKVSHLFHSN
jgi:protoporphyrinogen oxidase